MGEDKDTKSNTVVASTPYRFYGIDGEVIMTHNGVATVIDIDDDEEDSK